MNMKIFIVILIILFPLSSLCSFINFHAYTRMVTDFLNYYKQSKILMAFSCSRNYSLNILKRFGRKFQVKVITDENASSLTYPYPPNEVLFLIDIHCENSYEILKRANGKNLFAQPIHWLVTYNTAIPSASDLLQNYFQNIDILQDSDVTLAGFRENQTYILEKVYKRRKNSNLTTEFVGYWDEKSGFVDEEFEPNLAKRRRDLMGTTLRTSIVITRKDSLNHLTDKRNSHIDSIAKVDYALVKHLGDIVNASLKFTIQPTWGYKNKEGRWSGMIGELIRREADIGGTALFITEDRVALIDYIAMISKTGSTFILRQPKLSYVTNVFTLTFSTQVWISVLSLAVVTASVLYVAVAWELKKKKFIRSKKDSHSNELRSSYVEIFFITYAAVCQQGAPAVPYSIPGRIITIFLFISFMFLYAAYSANIVALLQSSSNSIRTLEDLLKSRLQVGVDDTVYNQFYFPNATEPIRRALYLKKVAPPGETPRFMSTEEGMSKMRDGLFAFHVETGVGYKLIGETFQEYEKCGLHEIQFLQVPYPWLAVEKNSSYKEILKIGLRTIQESGLQQRENSLIYPKKPQCTSRGSVFISVGLVDCYGAQVVLSSGIVLSLLIFILEFHEKIKKKLL